MEKPPTMNKMPMTKYLIMVFLLLIPLLLSGCWDRREINDVAFVLAGAFDKENDLYRVSILIPLPGNMGSIGGGGGGTAGVQPYTIQSEVGNTIAEAADKIQSRLSRKLFFAHRRVVLFGEDVAKDGLTSIMDTLARRPENRLNTFAAVTKGKAADFLSAKVKLERFSAELMRELLQSDATIRTSIKDVIARMNITGQEAFFPYLELTKAGTNKNKSDDIQLTGFSITKEGKQVAVLKDKDALAMRLLMPKFKSYAETLNIDNGKVSFHIRQTKTQIKPYINGNEINFDIKVDAVADIYEFLSTKDTFEEIPKINQLIESQMKLDLIHVIETLKTKGSDVIGFGQILHRHYPHKWAKDWERHWDSLFTKANFKVSVKVNIYEVGALSENLAKKGK
jgi:Ger(x)C family germination protein